MISIMSCTLHNALLAGEELLASVEAGLRSVNLWNNKVGDKQSRQYSGGMKRRLSVAISFMGKPQVVYMDEPSTVSALFAALTQLEPLRRWYASFNEPRTSGIVVVGLGVRRRQAGMCGHCLPGTASLMAHKLHQCQVQAAFTQLKSTRLAHICRVDLPYLQGLDPASRRNLWDVVKSSKRGRAIVLTTHSMEEAEMLCDRLGIFVDGRLVCIGNPREITSRYGGYLVRWGLGLQGVMHQSCRSNHLMRAEPC